MLVSSYHYLVGPLVAFGALGVILLLCRWVFAAPPPPTSGAPERTADYGLLVPVATVRTAQDAEVLREVLRDAGIRCTVSSGAGSAAVLVFGADAERARVLVSS